MLQQGSHDEQELPAAQVRVKAEELAQALAAIELRRQEEARRLEGTVVIGDAVQELQLDVTPDELLAEVQAQRARRQEEAETERTRPPEAWPFFWLVSKVLSSVVGAFMLLAWIMSLSTRPE